MHTQSNYIGITVSGNSNLSTGAGKGGKQASPTQCRSHARMNGEGWSQEGHLSTEPLFFFFFFCYMPCGVGHITKNGTTVFL